MVLREADAHDALPATPSRDRRDQDVVVQIVRRARGGDRDAFAELYRMHHAAIARLASFYLNGVAEDAVAETFVRAWKALPRYKETKAPFSAWLYAIARNVVADERRSQRRTYAHASPPDVAITEDVHDRLALAEAIARLPKEQRQVIEMKYLLGLRNPEVAEALGRTTGAINAIQWRALKKMRELLS